MFVQIKCSFCDQPFDVDRSSGSLLADCPHCGKQNTFAPPAGESKGLNLVHDAPNLSGAKSCPDCQAQIARDAILCIHCGYNLQTRQKAGAESWLAANQNLLALLGAGLLALAAGIAYLLWPETDGPPPAVVLAESPAIQPVPAAEPAPPAADAAADATAVPDAPAAAAESPPPPKLAKEELAAQKAEAKRVELEAKAEAERLALEARAEAERAAFEIKKFEAEQNLRLQLDAREPLYGQNELVELRRKNGVFHKGSLSGFSGTGTRRVVRVATATGEIDVPLTALDNASRRRLDPEYREAFIRHLMSTKLPAPPAEPPAD